MEDSNQARYYSATVGDSLSHAWHTMWDNIGILLATYIVTLLITTPNYFFSFVAEILSAFIDTTAANSDAMLLFIGLAALGASLLSLIYSFLVVNPVSYGFQYVCLKAARGERVEIDELFVGFKTYANVLVSSILLFLIVFVGFILLIVPGIIFACRLAFVPLLVVDRKMSATDAIKESWALTEGGYGWTVFGLAIVSFFIIIAGVLCLIVGVLFAVIWVQTAYSSLYHALCVSQDLY